MNQISASAMYITPNPTRTSGIGIANCVMNKTKIRIASRILKLRLVSTATANIDWPAVRNTSCACLASTGSGANVAPEML